jgi:hypothetical protein
LLGLGSGPAGVAAAHDLGLTPQVPSVEYIAVPVRPPRPIRGIRFVSRQYHRRELGLWPLEVAVLEVLRAGPAVIETEWPQLVDRIRRLADAGNLQLDILTQAAIREFDINVRHQYLILEKALANAAA